MGCAVAFNFSAFRTFMNDNEALFRIHLGKNRLHWGAAGVFAVARIVVNVERPQAKRTMISRGIAKGLYFFSAMRTDE